MPTSSLNCLTPFVVRLQALAFLALPCSRSPSSFPVLIELLSRFCLSPPLLGASRQVAGDGHKALVGWILELNPKYRVGSQFHGQVANLLIKLADVACLLSAPVENSKMDEVPRNEG